MLLVTMFIDINAIAFSPVAHDIETGDEDDWVVSTRTLDVDDRVMGIFAGYLSKVINKEDTGKVTVGHFSNGESDSDSRGDETQERLDELIQHDLSQADSSEYDNFEEIARSLKQRLISHMDGRTSRGYLFTIQATNNGDSFVGILKLDVVENEERPILDRDTRQLEYEEIQDAFPPTDELQKGCTYPVFDPLEDDKVFNLDGDVKFLQEDADSDYFEEFMECVTSSGSREQSQTFFEGLSEIKKEQDGSVLEPDDVQEVRTSLHASDGIADGETVHDAAENVLGDQYNEDDINDMLYEKGETQIQIDPNNSTKYVVYELDGIELKVPMSASDGDRIDIEYPEQDGGEYIITIRGESLNQDFQG